MKRKKKKQNFNLSLTPGITFLVLLFVIPVINLLMYSFFRSGGSAKVIREFTLENYQSFFTDAFYLGVLRDTFVMAIGISLITVVISYPVAYYLARTKSPMQKLVSSIVFLPLLASVIVTSYGWMILLSDGGFINSHLIQMGIIDTLLPLMYSKLGVYIAMIQVNLPYMITSIRNGLVSIDKNAESAAKTLGANSVVTFFTVTFPLSLPGVSAGIVLVFVDVLSSFYLPALLGGGKINTLATVILTMMERTMNWPQAATVSVILLVSATLVMYLNNRLMETKLFSGGGKK